MATVLMALLLFVLGTCVGSFLNVVVSRSLRNQQWWLGRSHCDHCHKTLLWWELLPVVSYIGLRGRCSRCHTSISLVHPFVELMMGVLFVWWYLMGEVVFHLTQAPLSIIQPGFWLIIGVLGVILVVADWKYLLLPDWIVGTLTLLAVVYRAYLVLSGVYQVSDFLAALLAAAGFSAGMALIHFVTRGRGLGWGDVKLMIPLSILAGWPRIGVAILLAVWAGAVVGVGGWAVGRWKWRQPIPFGPFMIIGTGASLWFGDRLLQWFFL